MSPIRRAKPSDSKDALDGQLCMHSDTGATLEDPHDEDEDDAEVQSGEEDLNELLGGFRFQGDTFPRLQTMREETAGDSQEDEEEEGAMQEIQFQRNTDSSASNVELFQHALDSDAIEDIGDATGTVGGAAGGTDNNSVAAGPSNLSKQCRSLASSSSLEAGTSGGRGCVAQGEYPDSARILVDEVDQRRSERRRGLNLGSGLNRGVLSLNRQRGSADESGSLIYQQVREEDEDKENEVNENHEEQNANERQQSMSPTEEGREPENEEEVFLSVCMIVSALRVIKLNSDDDSET